MSGARGRRKTVDTLRGMKSGREGRRKKMEDSKRTRFSVILRVTQTILGLLLLLHLASLVRALSWTPTQVRQMTAVQSVYVNPNPSPRSLSEWPASAASKRTTSSQPAETDSQPADWPFFKSFRSAKSNLNSARYRNPFTMEPQQASSSPASVSTPTGTTATTTTTTSTTTLAPTSELPVREMMGISSKSEALELGQPETTTQMAPTTPPPSTTTTSTTTTTTSTTVAPTTSAPVGSSSQAPDSSMFGVDFHSALQRAVDRIVQMTGEASKSAGKQSQPMKQIQAGEGGRSSLSLNVLLKNFGVNQLSQLDQILLKSSTRAKNDTHRADSSAEQRIQINGLQTFAPTESGQEVGEGGELANEDQSAECKIEYTMKHVNVTLQNGGKSDFSCDYIIDRKLATNQSATSSSSSSTSVVAQPPAELQVCKLQLMSDFFVNQPEQSCPNSTHLAIGSLSFCRLGADDGAQRLNRTFEFPVERDAFDIRLVHRQTGDSSARAGEESEIHLEIRPIADEDCAQSDAQTPPSGDSFATDEPSTSSPAPELSSPTPPATVKTSTTTTTTTTTTTQAPPTTTEAHRELEPKEIPLRVSVNPKRKLFVLRVSSDKQQPTANNPNRFRVSQTFDVGQPSVSGRSAGQPDPSQLPLCDGLRHSNTVGQLSSHDYPNGYAAHTSCAFVVSRASSAYCAIQLHFRDFDLLNKNLTDCTDDYLQIGQTRYCNRYAMIGHKMQLDLERVDEPLVLAFHSDGQLAGRGFLVKYQQLPCADSVQPEPPRRSTGQPTSTTLIGSVQPTSRPSTLAPAVQQPDFGLALRATTSAPAKRTPERSPTSGQLTPSASTVSSRAVQTTLDQQSATQVTLDDLGSAERGQCNQLNSERAFLLSSPGHPNEYPNNLQCSYFVRHNSSSVCYLELTFVRFDLEADADCRYDYLEINGVRLCGSLSDLAHTTSRIYQFEEPIKVLKFRSDQSGARSGFLVRVEQLDCDAQSGSIVRKPKELSAHQHPQAALNASLGASGGAGSRAIASTIQYDRDDRLFASPNPRTNPNPKQLQSQAPGELQPQTEPARASYQCDQTIGGREATIRSPLWPVSYQEDDSVSACKYTIVRHSPTSGNKICQLELRFITLRLGASDCIDIDGYELLCGLNTRNLVKYYPFEREPRLTVTFFTGVAKVNARSLGAGDLLPAVQRPSARFMIAVKQHECIDGFLAPNSDLSAAPTPLSGVYNRTNLLYSPASSSGLSISGQNSTSTSTSSSAASERRKSPADRLLRYDFSSVSSGAGERTATAAATGSSAHKSAEPNERLLIERKPLGARANSQQQCQLTFSQLSGVISSAALQPQLRQSPASECRIRLKLAPGYCQLQLSLTDFRLAGRHAGACRQFLQLDGLAYCSDELAGANRTLAAPAGGAGDRLVELVYASPANYTLAWSTFRALFRQLECQPEPLKAVRGGRTEQPPASGAQEAQVGVGAAKVSLREVPVGEQFFELNSDSLQSGPTYAPDSFVIYRILRSSADVCKIRLLFYRFELEQSRGCQRDFLDINKLERLCGHLAGDERVYDWPPSAGDFQLSFVSDSAHQLAGFQIFGQQLRGSSCSSGANSSLELPAATPTASASTTSTTSTTTTSTTTPAPAQSTQTFDEEPASEPSAGGRRPAGCNAIHGGQSFALASPDWPARYPAQLTCFHLIQRASSDVCALQLRLLSFVLSASSEPDCSRAHDYLELDGRRYCGLLDTPTQLEVPFGERQFLAAKFVSGAASGFGFYAEAKQVRCAAGPSASTPAPAPLREVAQGEEQQQQQQSSGCSRLITDELSQIESENFPRHYKHNQDCLYVVRRANESVCALELTLNYFDLDDTDQAEANERPGQLGADGANCNNADYLELDGSRLCGSYPAQHRLRFAYARGQLDKLVRFHSDASVARAGFSVGLRQLSDCQDLQPARQTEPAERETIAYLPDSSVGALNASGGARGPASGDQPNTLCQFVYHKRRQTLVSPNYHEHRRTYDHNLDCVYKVVARGHEYCALKLRLVDVDLEQSRDCHADYLLVDSRRLCGSNASWTQARTLELQFPEQLPREIHLLLHTDGRANAGRGFRIAYEQVPCAPPAGPAPAPADGRRARRLHLGRPSYPDNYVSSQSGARAGRREEELRLSSREIAVGRPVAE